MVIELSEYRCDSCGTTGEYFELLSFYANGKEPVQLPKHGLPESCPDCGSASLKKMVEKTETSWVPEDDPPLTQPVYLETDKAELTSPEELSKEAFLRWQNSWDSYQFLHYLRKVDLSLINKKPTDE